MNRNALVLQNSPVDNVVTQVESTQRV